MKKKFFWSIVLTMLLLTSGCFKKGSSDISTTVLNKLNNLKNYHLTGQLEIINNEDRYQYAVDVSYLKDDNFRVSLKNKTNDHEQIILKNKEGVFVLTPSLNKSFKFQSDWPYNSSQSYILQSVYKDLKNTKEKDVKEEKEGYVITTAISYTNNEQLKAQKLYVDKKGNLKKVEVYDKDNQIKMTMNFEKIDYKASFEKSYFEVNQNMSVFSEIMEPSNKKIEDIIYPMYLPENTHLTSEDKVSIENGERVILTFDGDYPFMLVEETAQPENEFVTIPVYGDLELLADTIATVTDNSVTWTSNGIEYYAVSETLETAELLEIVKSISTMPVGK